MGASTVIVADFDGQEANRLGQSFADSFLKIKRLVQGMQTYREQVAIWSSFTGEFLFPDNLLIDLEQLIDWKHEEPTQRTDDSLSVDRRIFGQADVRRIVSVSSEG